MEPNLEELVKKENQLNQSYNDLIEKCKNYRELQRKCEDELDAINFNLNLTAEQQTRKSDLEIAKQKIENQFNEANNKINNIKEQNEVNKKQITSKKIDIEIIDCQLKDIHNTMASKGAQLTKLKQSPNASNAKMVAQIQDYSEEIAKLGEKYKDLKDSYKNLTGKEYDRNFVAEETKEDDIESKINATEAPEKAESKETIDENAVEDKINATEAPERVESQSTIDENAVEDKINATEAPKEKKIKEKNKNNKLYKDSLIRFAKFSGIALGAGVVTGIIYLLAGPAGTILTNTMLAAITAKEVFKK